MPLYEYRCDSCGHRFELIERASSPKSRACPHCEHAARRLLGVPALQFKGSGWYVTDYGRGSAQSPSSEADTAGQASSESSDASACKASKDVKDAKKTAAA